MKRRQYKKLLDMYFDNYINLILTGLEKLEVTDKKSNALDVEEALDIWASKADQLRMVTKGLIFFCGNGASATIAEHMSHDWFQNALINTTTCAETSHITAISNDIGYDKVFSYRVERILSDADMLVGISSSGNSGNIVNAIDAANKKGAFTISVSGKEADNKIRQMADINFYVPLRNYGEVESSHAVLMHMALDYYLDKFMEGRH